MPVTNLRKHTSDVIRNIQQTNEIVYVTQNGHPSVVLIDYRQYEAMVAQLQQVVSGQKLGAAELLQSWIDEGDEIEQMDTGDALIEGLNESRLSERVLFPADMKGITW